MIEVYWNLIEPVMDIFDFRDVADYLVRFERSDRRGALLLATFYCEAEVCNGGFDQFFRNSTGILAPESVQGFKAIGQPTVASTVSSAMAMLSCPFERERAARNSLLDALPRGHFYDLEEQFFALITSENGGFQASASRFAQNG